MKKNLILCLVFIAFLVSSCCTGGSQCKNKDNANNECQELTEEKYVEGKVFLVATPRSTGGLIAVGDFSDATNETYLVSYSYHGTTTLRLGDKVYLKVKSCLDENMPMGYSVTTSEQSGLFINFKSNYKTHNAFDHGLRSGEHTIKHIWPQGINRVNNTISMGEPNGSGGFMAVGNPYSVSSSLITKANQLLGGADGKKVFFEFSDINLIDIDTCHYHNGINHGCL